MWESTLLNTHTRYDGRRCTVCAEEATSGVRGQGNGEVTMTKTHELTSVYGNTVKSIVLYNGNTLKNPDGSFLYFTLPLSQGSDHLKRH